MQLSSACELFLLRLTTPGTARQNWPEQLVTGVGEEKGVNLRPQDHKASG